MAKQPVAQDRFRIFAETSSAEMGPLLAQLTRMGLENIGYELITDVRTFGRNGPRQVNEITGDAFAAEWVKDHASFKALDLIQHFRDHGRTSGSGYTALKNLVAADTLRKLGPGQYQRADVKALPAPQATATARGQRGPYAETSNKDLIFKAIRSRAKVTLQQMKQLLEDNGRNPHSASPLMTKLAQAKMIKLIVPGEYQVLEKAKKAVAPKKLTSPADAAKKEKDRLRQKAKRERERAARLSPPSSSENAHG